MKKIGYLISIAIILAGCQQQPMIQIDSEVQASLEYKKSLNQQPEETATNESQAEVSPNWVQVNMDELIRLSDDTTFDFQHYVPAQVNDVRIFANGQQQYETYVDFTQEETGMYQMSERFANETIVKLYQLSDEQFIQQASYEGPYFLDNKLIGPSGQSVSSPRVLLQAPLQVGAEWTAYNNYKSQVTALYESVSINGNDYTNIVEVTTALEHHILKEYYAEGVGLIVTRAITSNDNRQQAQWQLVERYENAQMTELIQVVEPQAAYGHDIQWSEDILLHQTNETIEQAFMKFFIAKKWMTDTISVNRLMIDSDNVLVIDFSPGIVAAMNAHSTKEEGVLPAIVETMGRYYGVSAVKLTVNGHILLPDRLPYPPNGIWQVSSH